VKHVVYLSVKDVQDLPIVRYFKDEKAIRRIGIPYI